MAPQTLKGFRDFLPEEMAIRQKVINTLKEVFELYGFLPLETPALEYAETLLGKYGDEADKLIYKFKDLGGREIGLRYDLTVPLARVIATNPDLPMPFKRYQIQPVWRADKPQAGRYREFLQCDADIIGTNSSLADAELIMVAIKALKLLGFKNFKALINDLSNPYFFKTSFDIPNDKLLLVFRKLDKLNKIGKDGVINELVNDGFTPERAREIIENLNDQPTERIDQIFDYLDKNGVPKSQYQFLPSLTRGLDYYTSTVFEMAIDDYLGGSVAGGGRYDRLIGQFTGKDLPATGFSFGIDRLIEAGKQQGIFKNLPKTSTKVLVSIFSPEYLKNSIEIANGLRTENIPTELYLDPETKLDKQLKYADKKKIPFVIIIGPEEINNKMVTIKEMKTGEQEALPLKKLVEKLSGN